MDGCYPPTVCQQVAQVFLDQSMFFRKTAYQELSLGIHVVIQVDRDQFLDSWFRGRLGGIHSNLFFAEAIPVVPREPLQFAWFIGTELRDSQPETASNRVRNIDQMLLRSKHPPEMFAPFPRIEFSPIFHCHDSPTTGRVTGIDPRRTAESLRRISPSLKTFTAFTADAAT